MGAFWTIASLESHLWDWTEQEKVGGQMLVFVVFPLWHFDGLLFRDVSGNLFGLHSGRDDD